ncbi:MAG: LemA family protein [Candidatus Delongbacteria bacterium]|nr:LemA family protein [Candidatus Delongbacteria bacterium]MBN2836352.1 LemA family protein [Candidatus Delongbacteria bacterium]
MIMFAIGFLIFLIFLFMIIYNSFITVRNRSEEAYATMDTYLKKRWDIIPNLVETVKGYATHEKSTLENIVKARNIAMNSSNDKELKENENILSKSLKSVFALSENYPDLKANQNFLNLQTQLESIETDILNSRKYYNAVIRDYNTKIELFPQSLVASIMKLAKKEYFEIEENEKENIKIKF